jgi:predicted amidophosphoribosyltransferase
VLADLLDLVLPVACVGCGRAGPPLCASCGEPDVHPVPLDGLPVVAAARYEGVVRTALLAYKERGRRDLRRPLASLLAAALTDVAAAPAVVVPMPTTASARRARGGDHVLRLASAAARESRIGRVCTPLRLTRAVRDSAGLDIAERAANLHEAMVALPPRGAATAIVVDDITTTGASLIEATRALRRAGWQIDGAAVVAATPLRRPAFARRLAATSSRPIRSGLP